MTWRTIEGFFFFLSSSRLLKLYYNPSGLRAMPSALGLSVSGECQMGEIPAEDTPMLKSVKRVFGTLECTMIMTYLSSWNVRYLYYFNELILLGLISGMDYTYGCIT